jgi:hypothetical protein
MKKKETLRESSFSHITESPQTRQPSSPMILQNESKPCGTRLKCVFSSVSSTVKMPEQVSPFGALRHREKATLIDPLVLTRRVRNEPNVTETDAGSPKLREKCTRLFK